MIDEKVLIERLEEYKGQIDATEGLIELGRCVGIKKAIEIVNQLAEEHNNGWIAITERLPEDETIVLVQLDNEYYLSQEDETPLRVMKYEKSVAGFSWKEIGFNEWHMDNIVIAWQPLPAPYQPKGE